MEPLFSIYKISIKEESLRKAVNRSDWLERFTISFSYTLDSFRSDSFNKSIKTNIKVNFGYDDFQMVAQIRPNNRQKTTTHEFPVSGYGGEIDANLVDAFSQTISRKVFDFAKEYKISALETP